MTDEKIEDAAALARRLAAAIAAGDHAVGALLPTEAELCARSGLSRYSVRQALGELQAAGLISRKRNVGSRVEAAAPRRSFTHALGSIDELGEFGARCLRRIRATAELTMDRALAAELGCDSGTRWLRVSSVREDPQQPERPICWTDAYVDARFASIRGALRRMPDKLISTLIEERHGRIVTRIAQHVEAILVPDDLALALQVAAGSPALRITRRYVDAGGVVLEIARSVHPAERFRLSLELKRAP